MCVQNEVIFLPIEEDRMRLFVVKGKTRKGGWDRIQRKVTIVRIDDCGRRWSYFAD